MQARLSSLLAFLTDLWKLKEEALAKQGKSEVVLIKDKNIFLIKLVQLLKSCFRTLRLR